MPRIALYPGSFDPVTNGHLDVVRHAVALADTLVVAIGVHPGKAPLFSTDERLAMIREAFAPVADKASCKLDCVTFDDLVVNAASAPARRFSSVGCETEPILTTRCRWPA